MPWWYHECISNSNMTPFFRFTNEQTIYLDGKISLAHARRTYLSRVIKSQNNIIYTVGQISNKFLFKVEIYITHNISELLNRLLGQKKIYVCLLSHVKKI